MTTIPKYLQIFILAPAERSLLTRGPNSMQAQLVNNGQCKMWSTCTATIREFGGDVRRFDVCTCTCTEFSLQGQLQNYAAANFFTKSSTPSLWRLNYAALLLVLVHVSASARDSTWLKLCTCSSLHLAALEYLCIHI